MISLSKTRRISEQFEPQLPLGGIKDSGWSRSGPHSMADFTELQWITTRDGTGAYPI